MPPKGLQYLGKIKDSATAQRRETREATKKKTVFLEPHCVFTNPFVLFDLRKKERWILTLIPCRINQNKVPVHCPASTP